MTLIPDKDSYTSTLLMLHTGKIMPELIALAASFFGIKKGQERAAVYVGHINYEPFFLDADLHDYGSMGPPPTGYPQYCKYSQGRMCHVSELERDWMMREEEPKKTMGHTPHGGMFTLTYGEGESKFLELEFDRNGNLLCETRFTDEYRRLILH